MGNSMSLAPPVVGSSFHILPRFTCEHSYIRIVQPSSRYLAPLAFTFEILELKYHIECKCLIATLRITNSSNVKQYLDKSNIHKLIDIVSITNMSIMGKKLEKTKKTFFNINSLIITKKRSKDS